MRVIDHDSAAVEEKKTKKKRKWILVRFFVVSSAVGYCFILACLLAVCLYDVLFLFLLFVKKGFFVVRYWDPVGKAKYP